MAAVLCASPFLGILLTAWGIYQAYQTQTEGGAALDPTGFKLAVGRCIYPAAVTLVLALVGFPMALWAIIARQQRQWWLLMATAFASILLGWCILHGAWLYLTHPS